MSSPTFNWKQWMAIIFVSTLVNILINSLILLVLYRIITKEIINKIEEIKGQKEEMMNNLRTTMDSFQKKDSLFTHINPQEDFKKLMENLNGNDEVNSVFSSLINNNDNKNKKEEKIINETEKKADSKNKKEEKATVSETEKKAEKTETNKEKDKK